MARIVLIHWKPAEAEERANGLRAADYDVECLAPQGSAELRVFQVSPPAVFVVDLDRLPSQGRAVAIELRRRKGTRPVPIVFAGGAPEKVELVRALLPDAVYTGWDRIRDAIALAISQAPAKPVVPETMAGYSGTPLAKKLGIRSGFTVALLGAPAGFERTLEPLPEGAGLTRDGRSAATLALLFVTSRADLAKRFDRAARLLDKKGGIWLAWPKKTSGMRTDLAEPSVRAFGLERGFVDYKICAIDAKWSGLLFTRRKSAAHASS